MTNVDRIAATIQRDHPDASVPALFERIDDTTMQYRTTGEQVSVYDFFKIQVAVSTARTRARRDSRSRAEVQKAKVRAKAEQDSI